jgi:hypothetical protein
MKRERMEEKKTTEREREREREEKKRERERRERETERERREKRRINVMQSMCSMIDKFRLCEIDSGEMDDSCVCV